MSAKKIPFFQSLAWHLEAWLYDGFVALLRLMPIDTASDFGGWLFRVLGPLTPIQKTVERNLELAFPEMDADRRRQLITRQWENTGRTLAGEVPVLDRIIRQPDRVEIIGLEKLLAIAEGGKPVIFISGHLSNWEVMNAAILSAKVPYMITYRAANNPYF